jgi:FKBP-type peptidyl-prolyl cis-trans isomerase
MKVGGKRKIFVPSKIGYGPTGNPPTIPPNANLEFDIELLGIK